MIFKWLSGFALLYQNSWAEPAYPARIRRPSGTPVRMSPLKALRFFLKAFLRSGTLNIIFGQAKDAWPGGYNTARLIP
ncbi:MAG: hypothetical protein JWR09_4431 [Mucilaginibacter sp.]|nr:hypothetical protein [Mucilaginibacter sp.]